MIRVAVVDDEKKERDTMEAYFQRFQQEMPEKIQVTCYSSGEEFLQDKQAAFDLICLDIELGGQDGIAVAKEIRKNDSNVIIIFITNIAQMAIRGYEVQALDFVLKPLNYFSFAMKMRTACSMINSRKVRSIVLTLPDGIQRISTEDLLYAEVSGHSLYFHTKSGVYKQKASLSELENRLEGMSFKRCNNCYLVNLRYVSRVKKDDILVGEDWLKISRPRKKEFLQSLANYMGGISI